MTSRPDRFFSSSRTSLIFPSAVLTCRKNLASILISLELSKGRAVGVSTEDSTKTRKRKPVAICYRFDSRRGSDLKKH